MSTSPYALDLREKVINYLKKGHSQRSCAEVFSLHLSTVQRWWSRYTSEGHFNPRRRLGSKGKVDPQALIEYVRAHPEQTLKQIGSHFGVADVSIFHRLRKLGFSYKKKPSPMWRQMKKSADPIKIF